MNWISQHWLLISVFVFIGVVAFIVLYSIINFLELIFEVFTDSQHYMDRDKKDSDRE